LALDLSQATIGKKKKPGFDNIPDFRIFYGRYDKMAAVQNGELLDRQHTLFGKV
jgi:hypothetical protein